MSVTFRYPIGNREFPYFTRWCEEKFGLTLNAKNSHQNLPTDWPEPILSPELLEAIKELKIDHSIDGVDRLFRAHGHTLREIYLLKHNSFTRIPDIVLWPSKSLLFDLIVARKIAAWFDGCDHDAADKLFKKLLSASLRLKLDLMRTEEGLLFFLSFLTHFHVIKVICFLRRLSRCLHDRIFIQFLKKFPEISTIQDSRYLHQHVIDIRWLRIRNWNHLSRNQMLSYNPDWSTICFIAIVE